MDELRTALRETLNHLEKSADSGWSSMTVREISDFIRDQLEAIEKRRPINKSELRLLFAPTGDLQETSNDNGWAGQYLVISSVVDQFT